MLKGNSGKSSKSKFSKFILTNITTDGKKSKRMPNKYSSVAKQNCDKYCDLPSSSTSPSSSPDNSYFLGDINFPPLIRHLDTHTLANHLGLDTVDDIQLNDTIYTNKDTFGQGKTHVHGTDCPYIGEVVLLLDYVKNIIGGLREALQARGRGDSWEACQAVGNPA